jgi:uncharacterized protein (TIGR00162 family)
MPHLYYHFKPKFKASPILIAGFPGIASVGKIAAEHLIHSLNAKLFLDLYSEYLPEWALKRKDGLLDTIAVHFYWASPSDVELMIITSDAQAITPYGQYMLTEQILEVAREFGVKKVITAAAYVLAPGEKRKPVVGAGSSPQGVEWLKENGVEILEGGVIVGMNGLLPCLSSLMGMEGICLLGTTRGGLADPEAAKNILQVLSKLIKIEIDLEGIEERYSLPPLPSFELRTEEEEESLYIR